MPAALTSARPPADPSSPVQTTARPTLPMSPDAGGLEKLEEVARGNDRTGLGA